MRTAEVVAVGVATGIAATGALTADIVLNGSEAHANIPEALNTNNQQPQGDIAVSNNPPVDGLVDLIETGKGSIFVQDDVPHHDEVVKKIGTRNTEKESDAGVYVGYTEVPEGTSPEQRREVARKLGGSVLKNKPYSLVVIVTEEKEAPTRTPDDRRQPAPGNKDRRAPDDGRIPSTTTTTTPEATPSTTTPTTKTETTTTSSTTTSSTTSTTKAPTTTAPSSTTTTTQPTPSTTRPSTSTTEVPAPQAPESTTPTTSPPLSPEAQQGINKVLEIAHIVKEPDEYGAKLGFKPEQIADANKYFDQFSYTSVEARNQRIKAFYDFIKAWETYPKEMQDFFTLLNVADAIEKAAEDIQRDNADQSEQAQNSADSLAGEPTTEAQAMEAGKGVLHIVQAAAQAANQQAPNTNAASTSADSLAGKTDELAKKGVATVAMAVAAAQSTTPAPATPAPEIVPTPPTPVVAPAPPTPEAPPALEAPKTVSQLANEILNNSNISFLSTWNVRHDFERLANGEEIGAYGKQVHTNILQMILNVAEGHQIQINSFVREKGGSSAHDQACGIDFGTYDGQVLNGDNKPSHDLVQTVIDATQGMPEVTHLGFGIGGSKWMNVDAKGKVLDFFGDSPDHLHVDVRCNFGH